jgi:hypothetical protein
VPVKTNSITFHLSLFVRKSQNLTEIFSIMGYLMFNCLCYCGTGMKKCLKPTHHLLDERFY